VWGIIGIGAALVTSAYGLYLVREARALLRAASDSSVTVAA
jgi:hypothetical protein